MSLITAVVTEPLLRELPPGNYHDIVLQQAIVPGESQVTFYWCWPIGDRVCYTMTRVSLMAIEADPKSIVPALRAALHELVSRVHDALVGIGAVEEGGLMKPLSSKEIL